MPVLVTTTDADCSRAAIVTPMGASPKLAAVTCEVTANNANASALRRAPRALMSPAAFWLERDRHRDVSVYVAITVLWSTWFEADGHSSGTSGRYESALAFSVLADGPGGAGTEGGADRVVGSADRAA